MNKNELCITINITIVKLQDQVACYRINYNGNFPGLAVLVTTVTL